MVEDWLGLECEEENRLDPAVEIVKKWGSRWEVLAGRRKRNGAVYCMRRILR